MMSGSKVDVSDTLAGRVVIRGNDLQMSRTLIESTASDDTNIGYKVIDIDLKNELLMRNAALLASNFSASAAGDITINAPKVRLEQLMDINLELNIDHNYVADVVAYLKNPKGDTITLFSKVVV